jgi:hypothetical protein
VTFFRLHRFRAALLPWLALLALVVLPTLSRAQAPVDVPPIWAVLCGGGGETWTVHAALDACGHCSLAAAPLLPQAGGAVMPGRPGTRACAVSGCPAAVPREPPGAAWPRAPPVGAA